MLIYLLLIALSVMLVSCNNTPTEPHTLSVTPDTALQFEASGNDSQLLTITTNATDWSYTAPEWVVAHKTENSLTVNVTDNEGAARTDSIIITAYEATPIAIAVTQSAHIVERSIKQVVYLEVNDCNPLNILEYNLTDGTPFFDAVILFAANINYDSDNDVVYLHNNPNVQALLDHSNTFLQPLRERGIKVYLGLLGNHDAAGLAQLSGWGAEQWAQSVAETCRQYNLDGVNLDDEYSQAPIIDNRWFTQRSAKAGARLAYELKKALREKCDWPTEVSIYEYGALYDLPEVTIDGATHTQSEFIDFIVADYGGRATPYGDLTKAQCSGASIQLAHGHTLTERTAQTIVSKGYGWCMWFAFDPSGTGGTTNNREHAMEQFNVAAQQFYHSSMAQPAYVYNKIGEGSYDATPYPLP